MHKDIPIGILFFVISLFPLNYAYYLAGSPNIWLWFGMLICLSLFNASFDIAWRYIFPKKDTDVKL